MNGPIQHTKNEFSTTEAQVIAVSSRFDADAASSLALNLSICLARQGKRVCLFDANSNLLEHAMRRSRHRSPTLQDMLDGGIEVDELTHAGPGGVELVPPTTGIDDYLSLSDRQMQNLLTAFTQLQYEYDYVLIDSAAGICESTISYLLGPGSIFITITRDATSLASAFSLLKSIRQRAFQQPVRVVVNLVAGQQEARPIIARLGVTVRQYLGPQCAGLSFFIIDDQMLNVMSQSRLVMLEYPDSPPGRCLRDMAVRLAESDPATASEADTALTPLDIDLSTPSGLDTDISAEPRSWFDAALEAVRREPVEVMQPLMRQLNDIWQQRNRLGADVPGRPSAFELELLKLKTAIHFAGHVDENKRGKVN